MEKRELLQAMRKRGYPMSQMKPVLNDLMVVVGETLAKGEPVSVRGFGTLQVKEYKGHKVGTMKPGETREMGNYNVVTFTPGTVLKEAVKTGDASRLPTFFCVDGLEDGDILEGPDEMQLAQ